MLTQVVTILICAVDVPVSHFDRDTNYADVFFVRFLRPSMKMPGQCFKVILQPLPSTSFSIDSHPAV
jgi:hypothetical protein